MKKIAITGAVLSLVIPTVIYAQAGETTVPNDTATASVLQDNGRGADDAQAKVAVRAAENQAAEHQTGENRGDENEAEEAAEHQSPEVDEDSATPSPTPSTMVAPSPREDAEHANNVEQHDQVGDDHGNQSRR